VGGARQGDGRKGEVEDNPDMWLHMSVVKKRGEDN
jgi:hypothetical protein